MRCEHRDRLSDMRLHVDHDNFSAARRSAVLHGDDRYRVTQLQNPPIPGEVIGRHERANEELTSRVAYDHVSDDDRTYSTESVYVARLVQSHDRAADGGVQRRLFISDEMRSKTLGAVAVTLRLELLDLR